LNLNLKPKIQNGKFNMADRYEIFDENFVNLDDLSFFFLSLFIIVIFFYIDIFW